MPIPHDWLDREIFDRVTAAISGLKCLEIIYSDKDGVNTTRTVHPEALAQTENDGVYYLIAFCELRQESRTFRLDHIVSAKVLSASTRPMERVISIKADLLRRQIQKLEKLKEVLDGSENILEEISFLRTSNRELKQEIVSQRSGRNFFRNCALFALAVLFIFALIIISVAYINGDKPRIIRKYDCDHDDSRYYYRGKDDLDSSIRGGIVDTYVR